MSLPSIELLESTHKFPTQYIFKVIGDAKEGFLARTLATTRETAGLEQDPEFTVRQSAHGKHVSVTLSLEVDSAQKILKVYEGLSHVEGLVLLM